MRLIFVDCEAEWGKGAPCVGKMTEFGAVDYDTRATFHGHDDSKETMLAFEAWLASLHDGSQRPTMISDNPAFDWQWINDAFWKHLGRNPMGFSARRIGDFYAGLCGNPKKANDWKHLRVTKHDHNPVNDATGNAEAYERMLRGER